jgi:hypothetical protein
MDIVLPSVHIETKLARRDITLEDIRDCFANRTGGFPEDIRTRHITTPVTRWFVAEDNKGRHLKVAFIYYGDTKEAVIKSAYGADSDSIALYEQLK